MVSSFDAKSEFELDYSSQSELAALCHFVNMKRVVVTGLGAVSPLGASVGHSWSRLIKGECGVKALEGEEFSALPCRIAASVPRGTNDGEFDITAVVGKDSSALDAPFIAMGLAAADEALIDAKWLNLSEEQQYRSGVCVGSGIGSLQDIVTAATLMQQPKGHRKISPYFVPRILTNMAAGQISIRHGLKGPNQAISTACAAGSHAISDAYRLIKCGDADVMVCGGSESSINPLALAGFSRLRALATKYNDNPSEASRPFDADRNGFVMGEGSGILVLEELEHALNRDARIYVEVAGAGYTGDASHMTSPAVDGSGAVRCMQNALQAADIAPIEVDYVNAHATSTPVGDGIEISAIKQVFGSHSKDLSVSSTKGATGHLLGAAGALESIFCIKAIETSTIPPTLNLNTINNDISGVDLVQFESRVRPISVAINNSFGFGGTNSSIIFKSFNE